MTISISKADGIATVKLDRADKLNALTHDMYEGIADAFAELSFDDEVRAQAVKVLGDHKSAADTAAFLTALTDPNNRVKFFAAQALGRMGPADTPRSLPAPRATTEPVFRICTRSTATRSVERAMAAIRCRAPIGRPTPAPSRRSASGSPAYRNPRRAATSRAASPSTSRAGAAKLARATA